MTPGERQRMREALSQALGTSDLPDGGPAHPGAFTFAPEALSAAALEDRFQQEIEALGGTVHRAQDVADVAAVVHALAAREGGSDVLAWDDEWFPVTGVTAALAACGLDVLHQAPAEAQDSEARSRWAGAVVGLTSASALLAQTGSVVVVSGPGRGRLASLLPPVHVAVVSRRRMTFSLPALLVEQPDLATSGTNMVVITGPSRTADIEHTLSRGVHGPREIHVILVD